MSARRGLGASVCGLAIACASLAGCTSTASVRVRVLAPGEDCARDFGSSTAAAKIETYLLASDALRRTTDDVVADLESQCHEGLVAAGVRTVGQAGAAGESSCDTLAHWIEGETAALAASPRLASADGACSPSEAEFAGCISRCELRYRPEDVHVVSDEAHLLTAPNASPRCRSACGTLNAIETTCASSSRVEPGGEGEREARLRRVLDHAARAIDLGERARRIALAAAQLVAIAPVLPEAAATVSIRAVACVSAAAEPARLAAERLDAARLDTVALRALIR